MRDIVQFVAMPFHITDRGLVPGEPFKCATPDAAIERAEGYWRTPGHAGAVAFVHFDYPVTRATILRRFGRVPNFPVEWAPED
jgi:hypothetical protein